jgi:cobaltochelatase CobT
VGGNLRLICEALGCACAAVEKAFSSRSLATLGFWMAMDDQNRALFRGLLDRIVGRESVAAPYHAYTKQFDVEVAALNLDDAIGALTSEEAALLRQASQEFDAGLLPWKTRLHILAAEAAGRVRQAMPLEDREATIVSLLFDQSGSMRGQKMLFAAAAADACQEFLQTLKVRVEVLGFTTVRWRGGKSRSRWISLGRLRFPGRLNDLLHIVYRPATDTRASTGGPAFRQMLRPDLPKENIDGEALEWAIGRLRNYPQPRKILIVISDGAPVDDSTLDANSADYLFEHLKAVIETVEQDGDVVPYAMGLGFEVGALYKRSAFVGAPDELGAALLSLIERALTADDPIAAP